MLWWFYLDFNDGRIFVFDSINSGVLNLGMIDFWECWLLVGVRGKVIFLGILLSKVLVL